MGALLTVLTPISAVNALLLRIGRGIGIVAIARSSLLVNGSIFIRRHGRVATFFCCASALILSLYYLLISLPSHLVAESLFHSTNGACEPACSKVDLLASLHSEITNQYK